MSSEGKIKLSLTTTKRKTSTKTQSTKAVLDAFGGDHSATKNITEDADQPRSPLVIPVRANKPKFHIKKEDAEAVRILEAGGSAAVADSALICGSDLVIQSGGDTFKKGATARSDQQQYQDDIKELPDEPSIDSDQYQRVPIADFGAALLRGMGWTGDDGTKKEGDATDMPRPHRLGLGATPKLDIPEISHRARRPHELKRQEALQKQQEEYAAQRKKQLALDKQRTMQDGSLVQLRNRKRAEIKQLMGVPGLNMVKVQLEGKDVPSIIKRGDIDHLLTRDELDEFPFTRPKVRLETTNMASSKSEGGTSREKETNKRRRSEKREHDKGRKSMKRKRDDGRPQWAISNIRVRVVTEK